MSFVRLNLKPYVVTRSTPNPPVAGRKVAATTATVNITANIQPANGDDLKALPEARRVDGVEVIYTESQLYVGDTTHEADRISIRGVNYEVFKVETWPRHYRCYASKLGNP